MMRTSRIVLNNDILRASAWLCTPTLEDDFRLLPEYGHAARVTKVLIEDIIASIPGHLGCSLLPDEPAVVGTSSLAMFTLWPIFLCKISDFATDAQQKWISGRLRYIANDMGLMEAAVYAGVGLYSHST
jgi:hypothetical protein